MNRIWMTFQTFFFCLFLACGVAALAVSALSQEIADYYFNKNYLANTQRQIEELKEISAKYDEQISFIKQQPEALDRLNTIQLGRIPEGDEQTFYPAPDSQLTLDALAIASQSEKNETQTSAIPAWVETLNQPKRKMVLFGLGAVLILTAFGCFGGVANYKD